MDKTNKKLDIVVQLTPEQKKRFQEYIPLKVYATEKNIAIIVALIQLVMIIVFMNSKHLSFAFTRTMGYFSLYVFLFVVTCIAVVLYPYTVNRKKYSQFFWLRRIYTACLCLWVLGITCMELLGGKSLSVYCYLLPTTAAFLLLTPLESAAIFGCTWLSLVFISIKFANSNNNMFGYIVNGILVTVLSFFISYRYYRSTAIEFCDRDIISRQYDEIQRKNDLLVELVNIDQLTGLNNRHYLLNNIYPLFASARTKGYYGMCLMLDIDYFKQYNDLYGHVQGDVCLQRIAGIIRTISLREDASPIRYGGEEFLIIKISEQAFDAEHFAQNLLSSIKKEHIERDDVKEKYVTVSAGLWYGNLKPMDHIEAAIKYADDALYEAKKAGRNRIISSDLITET
ncbi:GGDEF domain-containing protein [Robinsoniella peoriensis]|uniref:GGDEF domain-containing protein n=1 Tax=Robinsoniella peoriensis TaxID=180332 RepID=UPI00085CCC44|nr:GGDEF domain-containing protein [Robinsoniella peoriensis]